MPEFVSRSMLGRQNRARRSRAEGDVRARPFAVAVLLHVLLLAVGRWLPPVARARTAGAPELDAAIQLEMEPFVAPRPVRPEAPERADLGRAPGGGGASPRRPSLAAGGSRSSETGAPAAVDAGRRGEEGPPPTGGDGFDEPSDDGPPTTALSLSARIALNGRAPPARSDTPRSRRVDGVDVDRALGFVIRAQDALVGLGSREESSVALAVQESVKPLPLPSGTRARFEIDIDAEGHVSGARVTSASRGDESTWNGAVAAVRAALSEKPLDVGPEARRSGIRVVVDATILHVFSNGTDGKPVVGECPKMPALTDREPAPFGLMGGAPYGRDPNGTCLLQDAGDFKHEHIEVRTNTSVVLPGAPPPLASSLPKPRPPVFSLMHLLFDDHSRHGERH